MSMLDQTMRQTIAAQLRTRLMRSRALRQRLLANPKAVLAEEFDVQTPDDLRVTVVENTPFHQYLSLPAPSGQPTADAQPAAADEFEDLVRQRAAQDETFRQQVLADPKGALEGLLHFKFPAQMHITAVEETPQTWYLVCPPLTDLLAEELDDQTLEAVAGGASSIFTKDASKSSGTHRKTSNERNHSFHRPRYPICH